ncbi:aminomethyl-transferring glycine dehydrogenase subunit GcvPA [Caldanaerobacter subterraneus]|uniref:Probable glycine dehydrogenase (decarboxylating) subunit 1 n=1 Tax=Caldanaerobacter subterraneus TaxID=911092 RepID=A0A7Y2LAT7_9THEO|nr:aminomethyl-transferring glycine dehydrogenase subunit GcvPA [Caldanaerobacter subterraneus]NNG67576.1 aminomethyl-transferring glycine dehydrogenase subunit GcvPA [Caldanaerobacter subterraneus]
MFPYLPISSEDEKEMLKTIGKNSIEELFEVIPKEVRLNRPLNLGKPMSELEVRKRLGSYADENKNLSQLVSFLGAGVYDHYIPSVVKHIISRSEFYTAYTPYQPEISQGTLQAIFEYQTMITNLTGMEVTNASMYDGASACAEAAMMACDATKRKSIIVSKTVNPETRKVLKTYMHFREVEVVEIEDAGGETDIEKLKEVISPNTAAVIVQYPNFFGIIENLQEIEKITHEQKAMLITYVHPIPLGILKSPGEIGADIAVGDGQSLGNGLHYGGPYLGFLATTQKLLRRMPGRIVGQTKDVDGKRGFVLTLQAREQHIRREKATSNICSNHSLNALTAAVYLATMGKKGIKEVAYQCLQKAHYAYTVLTESGKYKPAFNKPFFMEFALKTDKDVAEINKKLLEEGILGGYDLQRDYEKYKNVMLLAFTEKRTKEEIDRLKSLLEVM